MILTENMVFQERYKIIRQQAGYPFFAIYETLDLTYKKKYLLIEYDSNSISSSFRKEVGLWSSDWSSIFPPILDQWKIDGKVYFALNEMTGVPFFSLSEMGSSSFKEKEALNHVPALLRLFESLHSLNVHFKVVQDLAYRILYFPEGEMLLAPVFLTVLYKKNNMRMDFLEKGVIKIPEKTYVKAAGEILCYFLTQSFSENGNLPVSLKKTLSSETFEFLKNCVSGGIESFELFDKCVSLLEKNQLGNQIELIQRQTEASSESLKPTSIPPKYEKQREQTRPDEPREVSKTKIRSSQTNPIFAKVSKISRQTAAYLKSTETIPNASLVLFFRSLATLLETGVPLITALEILQNQEENSRFKGIILDLRKKLGAGKSFSRSLELHPELFNKLHVGMVMAGEEGGQLAMTVRQIAEYEEKNRNYWLKFRSALVYPAFVLFGAFAAVIGMCYLVLPRFSSIFASLHVSLPLPTQLLMFFAHRITLFCGAILVLTVVLYVVMKQQTKTVIGKLYWDHFKYTVPVVSRCWRSVNIIHFLNVFLILVNVGVPVLQALKFYGEMAVSPLMGEFVEDFSKNLTTGATIREALSIANEDHNGFFPKMAVDLFSTIQETGAIQEMSSSLIRFYEKDLDFVMGRTLDLLEPLVVVILGGVVGFILIAVFLPIYSVVMNLK
jgi:type IV pilus assembly protein PilC